MAEAAVNDSDIRPLVARDRPSNAGFWAFMALVVAGGIWLFSAMNASRTETAAPRTTVAAEPGVRITSPPPLSLPQEHLEAAIEPRQVRVLPPRNRAPVRTVVPSPGQPRIEPAARVATFQQLPAPPLAAPQPQIVFDSSLESPTNVTETPGASTNRILAGRLANPSHTIPQGTVIPAVLETALDSTRPGGVRALVQRDVYGFDGARVLVHRGSRLYGEYEADLQRGQKRALIRWTRLIRPDGVTVALDSPASDPLGRAGVKGKVDSKFFQRFGGAILQSVLDIGVGIATREATDGVVVALPGSTQNLQVQRQGQVQPTLKVRHGTSVSVFVARDLDFSSVDF